MKMCPMCGGKKFTVSAHVVETWLVDANEEWVKTISCDDVVRCPNDEDLWVCEKCGHEGAGKEFEVDKIRENTMRLLFNEMVSTLINRMEDDRYEPYGGMSTVWIYDKKTKQRYKLEITEDND